MKIIINDITIPDITLVFITSRIRYNDEIFACHINYPLNKVMDFNKIQDIINNNNLKSIKIIQDNGVEWVSYYTHLIKIEQRIYNDQNSIIIYIARDMNENNFK